VVRFIRSLAPGEVGVAMKLQVAKITHACYVLQETGAPLLAVSSLAQAHHGLIW
jgi:hypothetical protein